MQRRALLATLVSAGTVTAGCLGENGNEANSNITNTQTQSSSATATSSNTELMVERVALQSALVELNTDFYELVAEDNRQYLVLNVSVISGPLLSRSELSFRFDGTDHMPVTWEQIPARKSDGLGGEQYSEENGAGWVVFGLPETGDASDAALVWPGGEWRPEDRLREQLATPLPTLSVEEWRVPETVLLDSTAVIEFTVRNEGEQTGWFVGGINTEGWYPHRSVAHISREIPAGETASWEVQGDEIELKDDSWSESVGDGQADIEYELIWPNGSERAPTRVVERLPANQALVIESKIPVEGTMVNIGVEGAAKNAASGTLVDCVIKVTGEVGDQTFSGQATRDELAPDETWEWEVSFGEEADASDDDSVENISIETRAKYAE